MDVKKTPLYGNHERAGARIVDFHGWMMPVQYKGVIEEHMCVREKAGLFDVSHMGEFLVFGSKATEFVNHLVTNDVNAISDGQCMYTPMCYENGTIVDDLLVYKHNSQHYMLVVNASNIDKDYKWVRSHMGDISKSSEAKICVADEDDCKDDICLRDVSDGTAMLALQGPKAKEILPKLTDFDVTTIKRFFFKDNVMVGDVKALVSRTGYTGEDGFELYVNARDGPDLWENILDASKGEVQPIGLGARDTLRLESALMLYGNDIDDTTTPYEAIIGWTVKLDKKEFIGKDALVKQKASGVKKKLVGFELVDRGVPRQGYKIEVKGKEVGHVTSGTFSPVLKKSIGLGYVKAEYKEEGTAIDIMIRDNPCKATVVELPFYKRG
ncbi:MAG: glycine cleavage system aminomethyltransferase GcvT [Candidatus Altiarchaeota archaeon]